MIKERILEKLYFLENCLSKFPEILPKTEGQYLSSFEKQLAIERLLHISLECMLDISFQLIKLLQLGMPQDEESIYEKLKPYLKKSETYKEMKGFRNVIVHRYVKINNKLVYNNVADNIDDFYYFIKEVKTILLKK